MLSMLLMNVALKGHTNRERNLCNWEGSVCVCVCVCVLFFGLRYDQRDWRKCLRVCVCVVEPLCDHRCTKGLLTNIAIDSTLCIAWDMCLNRVNYWSKKCECDRDKLALGITTVQTPQRLILHWTKWELGQMGAIAWISDRGGWDHWACKVPITLSEKK